MNSCVEVESEIQKALLQSLNATTHANLSNFESILLENPKEERFGDYSTNIAMRYAKELGKSPRELATSIKSHLDNEMSRDDQFMIESVEIAGPGFINIKLAHATLRSVIREIQSKKDRFGASSLISGKRVLLEYVSANPTGPLTIAHGRQAAFGDSLLRILRFVGYSADAEYYNNDVGVQIQILGESVYSRCKELQGEVIQFPENGYQGEYIKTLAEKLLAEKQNNAWMKDRVSALRECSIFARDAIGSSIKKDLKDFGVHFDQYYSQENLDGSGKVELALQELEKSGDVYEQDGAKWLRSTVYGDDKDRVVVKSDGSYTYLMPDIAYHREKFLRGYTDLINILGPDHHGYIKRLKASQKALGYDPERITILIAQLVTLYEGDKQLKMSTRAGEFVTLRELMDEVGQDAARFFFLTRKCDSHLDFDLELAKKQSSDNPVFYIQYAHARIANFRSVFEKKEIEIHSNPDLSQLSTEEDIKLLRMLRKFRKALHQSADGMDPHALIEYLQQLASAFHQYYQKQRIAMPEDAELSSARLMLAEAVQQVIKNGLSLLGVSAPNSM